MRVSIRVEGIVQGVGFRPFVHGVATRLGLSGHVGNDARGVFIEVEGGEAVIAAFLDALEREAPAMAVVERVRTEPIPARGERGFRIVASAGGGARAALISADTATCDDCLRELFDPGDRRHRFPFINCTNCGPRFTIVRDVPYDRPFTTMAGFAMCAECAREYADPGDRRFHAQPVCCAACGPALCLVDADGAAAAGDPIAATAERLLGGQVVAIKGLGGYHLAADAACDVAVRALRGRKHREDKPFAVMTPDLESARALCSIGAADERLLRSPARPIVLVDRRSEGAALAEGVAPGNCSLGIMLPYTPVHHLLAGALGRPFVLTSGNVSDEPIAYDDDVARKRLAGIADAFLVNDRPIHMRTDDSVARTFRDRPLMLRRSRGYVPQPLSMPWDWPRPVLACGAEQKSTFCLAKGPRAFVSHHIGDLENYETMRSFTEGIAHFRRLFDITPEVVVHDLHPDYLSTRYATELAEEAGGVQLLGAQHHHAHIAACLADNGEEGPVIGVAFDGTGYGVDGTIWGGEFLVASLTAFERLGSLDPVPMPGGAAAIRAPWRMAAAYLQHAGLPAEDLEVGRRHRDSLEDVLAIARSGVHAPLTSSAGRLFDAVSALLGVRDTVNYEGQAAVELEQRADPSERGGYPAGVSGAGPFRVAGADLVRAVTTDLVAGVAVPIIAARFHNAVAGLIATGAERIRATTGLGTVALSGGVFQNRLLLERAVSLLEQQRFAVLLHRRVPPNDGGISLGQAAIAAATDRAARRAS